jgi:hypothetical protein
VTLTAARLHSHGSVTHELVNSDPTVLLILSRLLSHNMCVAIRVGL